MMNLNTQKNLRESYLGKFVNIRIEDAVILHYPTLNDIGNQMFSDINIVEQRYNLCFLDNQNELFPKLMGNPQQGIPFESHIDILKIIAHYVQVMYSTAARNREGIGFRHLCLIRTDVRIRQIRIMRIGIVCIEKD